MGKPDVPAHPDTPATAGRRVLLICPPFQSVDVSSLSTALLGTLLRKQRHVCAEAYLHFDFARLVGVARYRRVTEGTIGIEGELLFAEALHGALADPSHEAALARLFGTRDEREKLLSQYEAELLERVEAERPDLVGLTTSFSQLLPALWMTRAIKRRWPAIRVVLGGSGCCSPMGGAILETYPEVDWAVSGPGERPLVDLAHGLTPENRLIDSDEPVSLSDLPIVDYGRYLKEAAKVAGESKPVLAFESSRGCWWGQKHQCAFCGLNGLDLAFSQKPSSRVADEVRILWERYGHHLFATDLILSREHMKGALAEIAALPTGPLIFYEIKTNVRESDVVALRKARVRLLQPGIESLSTRLLKLLGKGSSLLDNLSLLKWCQEQQIVVRWNLLCAIPGERPEDYEAQCSLIHDIPHLTPPGRVNPVRIDRYSPYFSRYLEYGWKDIEPLGEYRSLHPTMPEPTLRRAAYHFRGVDGVTSEAYLERLNGVLADWRQRNKRGDGLFYRSGHGLVRTEAGQSMQLRGDPRSDRVLECTHTVVSVQRVFEQTGVSEEQFQELVRQGVLYVEDERVINLAVRVGHSEVG